MSGRVALQCCSQLGIVPTGAVLTPPTHNVYDEEAYSRLAIDNQLSTPEGLTEERERLDRIFGS